MTETRTSTLAFAFFCLAAISYPSQVVAEREDERTRTKTVRCGKDSIQRAVDRARGPTKIFIVGECEEDVLIKKDDIVLTGNKKGGPCDREEPGGAGSISGTIEIRSARARVEFLTITGANDGIDVTRGGIAEIECNSIVFNEATGVAVIERSFADLRDNLVSENGQRRLDDPFVFFDCGLIAVHSSAIRSRGNIYRDNQFCAIEIDTESHFENATFIPRDPEFTPDPSETDTFIQRGCIEGDFNSCADQDGRRTAITSFNGGNVVLRNFQVTGYVDITGNSHFRVDAQGNIFGNIVAQHDSLTRIVNRSNLNRFVSFVGTLSCFSGSRTFFSNVFCGQTCSGLDGNNQLICTP